MFQWEGFVFHMGGGGSFLSGEGGHWFLWWGDSKKNYKMGGALPMPPPLTMGNSAGVGVEAPTKSSERGGQGAWQDLNF